MSAVHHRTKHQLPDLLGIKGVFADQQRGNVIDNVSRGSRRKPYHALAPAGDPLVGLNLYQRCAVLFEYQAFQLAGIGDADRSLDGVFDRLN